MEKEIIEMMQNKGWVGALLGLILITIISIFKSKYFVEIWSKIKDKFANGKTESTKLTSMIKR